MKRRDFLERWDWSCLKLNIGFLNAEFKPTATAWDLYIELLTRITTRHLAPGDGAEKTTLDSVYALFPLPREILRKHGSGCGEFAKLAIPVLNQIIRPFTAKWHRLSLAEAFKQPSQSEAFRAELAELQPRLRKYTQALAARAPVEDLRTLAEV